MDLAAIRLDRFWSKVRKTARCWLWTGAAMHNGRGGVFRIRGKSYSADRVAWAIANGESPTILRACPPRDGAGGIRKRRAKRTSRSRRTLLTGPALVTRAALTSRSRGEQRRKCRRRVRLQEVMPAFGKRAIVANGK